MMKQEAKDKKMETGTSMAKHKIYEDGERYIERIRQVVGEELWDRVYEEIKNGREVHSENTTALRNSV